MDVRVGTAIAEPGRRSFGGLEIGTMADGSPVAVPVIIAAGQHDGPVLWVQGCIHGDEYGGAAALIEFARALDVEQLQGVLIALPVVNPSAFNLRARLSNLDGQNMNRVFPASDAGSYSFQVGARLAEEMKRCAHYLLDLHNGGLAMEVPLHMIYMDDGSATAARSLHLAKSLACDVIWRGRASDGYAGTLIAEASRAGIPGVLVENGGGDCPTGEQIDRYGTCLESGLRALGMLPGEPVLHERYTMIGSACFLHARRGGLFVRRCQVGAIVDEGAPIGRIIDLHGETAEEIASPAPGRAFIAGLRTSWFPTHAGEMVGEVLTVEGYESFEPAG